MTIDVITGEGIEESPEVVEMVETVSPTKFLPWVEKYRPETIDDLILPDGIKNIIETAIKINSFGNYILYSGKPGTGKTSLAKALPATLGTQCLFLSAKKPAEFFSDIEDYAAQQLIDGVPRFVVIDEADHPRNPADFYRQLQTTIETTASTLRFILTCNEFYRIPEPITSRCFPISFDYDVDNKDLKKRMAKRILHIAREETAAYHGTVNKSTIVEIVNKCYPDMRLMISTLFNNFLENKCSIDGSVTIAKLESNTDLINLIFTGNDLAVRNYIRENFVDFDGFFLPFANDMIMNIPPHARLEFNVKTAYYADMFNRQVNPFIVMDGYLSSVITLLKQAGAIK